MVTSENCPCKKKKCERHGKCDECRKHHAGSKRPRPCEKRGSVSCLADELTLIGKCS